ncbi:MAG: SDR family oxidoreductase [Alphaproteobacteria bacterium]
MKIDNCVALVTGANRGIGKAFVDELLARGAKKVYAAGRRLEEIEARDRVVPVRIDVTSEQDVKAAAAECGDVNLLINNAGVVQWKNSFEDGAREGLEQEMAVNYWGSLAMSRAFAPVLEANGGGALVNILSIAALMTFPFATTYCVSKAAEHSMTQSLRGELAGQGTLVVSVYPGPVDTRMIKDLSGEKLPPAELAATVFDGIEDDVEYIVPRLAREIVENNFADPKDVERQLTEEFFAS